MIQLAGYFTVLLHAAALIGMAASVGVFVFCALVLRPAAGGTAGAAESRLLRFAVVGALLTAAALAGMLLLGPWSLADGGAWPIREYLATGFARASVTRLALVLGCAGALFWLGRRPDSAPRRALVAACMAAMVFSGAWTVHAVSRLHDVLPLMVATTAHQLAAVVWTGGVMALLVCRNACRPGQGNTTLWPRLLARFSPLGMLCVAVIIAAGVYVASHYVGDPASIYGTGYGVMVVAKVLLLATALTLATLNLLHTRRWRASGDRRDIATRVPVFIEVELVVLLAILLLGASVAATPPAADMQTERATVAEVLDTIAPKRPRLTPPDHAALLADYSSPLEFFEPSTAMNRAQSNFNHNASGAFVLLIGVLAILHRLGLADWARHWPLLFLPFAAFLQVIVQPTGWPLGNEGFFEQLRSPSVVQHRLATLLPLVIGVMEWRVQTGVLAATRWRYTFPVLCFVGAAVLLTHTHTALGTKREFLIEVSHVGIGIFALMAGIGRWLELRLPAPASRFAGVLWTTSLMAVGLLLLFYEE